jgi:hypothetical protein
MDQVIRKWVRDRELEKKLAEEKANKTFERDGEKLPDLREGEDRRRKDDRRGSAERRTGGDRRGQEGVRESVPLRLSNTG